MRLADCGVHLIQTEFTVCLVMAWYVWANVWTTVPGMFSPVSGRLVRGWLVCVAAAECVYGVCMVYVWCVYMLCERGALAVFGSGRRVQSRLTAALPALSALPALPALPRTGT